MNRPEKSLVLDIGKPEIMTRLSSLKKFVVSELPQFPSGN
jgi:hypothetical protein